MTTDQMKKMASNILKAELAKRGLKLLQLHKKLNAEGAEDSYDTMRLKINRGSFSFAYFLVCMKAIGAKQLNLEEYLREDENN